VVNVTGNKIYYQPTEEIIKRREVDLDEVALFESLGTCFGRKPRNYEYELLAETSKKIERFL
jgi:6-phosphofructokinase 1